MATLPTAHKGRTATDAAIVPKIAGVTVPAETADFTIGPWKWSRHYDTIRLTAPNGEWVLSCYGGGIKNEADRALIGAAPEMYEALTALVEFTRRQHSGMSIPHEEEYYIVRDAAVAALAKARGEAGDG